MRRILLALLGLLAFAVPAYADDPDAFSDCTIAGGDFSKAIDSQGQWTCAEMVRRRIAASGAYSFPARIVRSSTIEDSAFKSVVPQMLDKLETAFRLWAGKIDLGFPGRITILLVDPAGRDMPGLTDHGEIVLTGQSECVIRVNLAGITADLTKGKKGDDGSDTWVIQPGANEIPRQIDKVVAHEAAHCVQNWRNPEQAKLTGKGGDWWLEGSAEMMASLAVPRANTTMDRYKQFDADSGALPLTTMSYQSVVFWQWLWNLDPKLVTAAWAAMPTAQQGGVAQAQALVAFFKAQMPKGVDAFQTFAQDYLDGKIVDVTGAAITAADYGAPQEISGESGSMDIDAKALTIWRHTLVFSGGEYTIKPIADAGLFYSTPTSEWAKPVPDRTPKGDCKTQTTWNLAVMPLDPLKLNGVLGFTREKECEACQVGPAHDQCLAGDWVFDRGALSALLVKLLAKAQKDPDPTLGGGDMTVHIDESGQATMDGGGFQIFTHTDQSMGEGQVRASIWIGVDGKQPFKWSSSGLNTGYLSMCRLGEGDFRLATMVTITDMKSGTTISPPEYTPVPMGSDVPPILYTCQGDTILLQAEAVGPGGTTLTWALHRVK